MDIKNSNPCTRCGKQRIDGKTWKEKITTYVGTSVVIHTDTVCPDKECQKIVDAKLTEEREKKKLMDENREKRMKVSLSNRKKKKELSNTL